MKIFQVNYGTDIHEFIEVENKESTSSDYVTVYSQKDFDSFLEEWSKSFEGIANIEGNFDEGYGVIYYE